MLYFLLTVPQFDPTEVCTKAYSDAERRFERYRWIAAGAGASLFIPVVGSPLMVVLSYFISPSSPIYPYGDLSNDSVRIYSQCYTKHTRALQVKNTAIGCALAYSAIPLLYVFPALSTCLVVR